ncbi:MAG: DUF502 domain-containing protein [Candidatus Marinimicrobia bacterium]|nr:DUF502 domain-containing protein [Candidatus Neomarinimicrobiota bacterium]
MKKLFEHLKKFALRGLMALIPATITYFVIRFVYFGIDKRMMSILEHKLGFSIPGMGIVILIAVLYLTGLAVSNVIGRGSVNFLEKVFHRLPLIRTTYRVGQQLSNALALPQNQLFKRAVLINYLKPGIWTIGFVTGSIIDTKNDNETLLKVFVPTPPIPTSGTMVLVRESDTRDPGWTIEESLQTVISGGLIGPGQI